MTDEIAFSEINRYAIHVKKTGMKIKKEERQTSRSHLSELEDVTDANTTVLYCNTESSVRTMRSDLKFLRFE